MKTIISNNCVGAEIFRQLHQQYNNPFMWNLIQWQSYFKLIEDFDNIDFTKTKMRIDKDNAFGENQNTVTIMLQDGIEIPFVHYHKDNRYSRPKKGEVNIFYKDIEKFAQECWTRRLDRMQSRDILFIYINRERPENDKMFAELKTPYKKLLLTQYNDFDPKDCGFPVMHGLHTYKVLAERIIKQHGELLV